MLLVHVNRSMEVSVRFGTERYPRRRDIVRKCL